MLQSDTSIDSCGGPSASKRPRTKELTEGESDSDTSSSSEDTADHGSVVSSGSSDHSVAHSHGAARGRGSARGRGAAHGRGTARGHGRGRGTTTANPLGTWKKEEPTSLSFNYPHTPGPRVHLGSTLTPSQLFCKYFTDEVWDLLVTETNRYACLRFPCRQHARPWTDVSIEEMKAFIGMLILMGVLQLPRIEMYWQIDDDLIKTPGVSSIMSRVRFQQIF